MALASVSYPTDGVNGVFGIPFLYIDRSHIHVYVNGVEVGFSWLNANNIQLIPIPDAGLIVTISRVTPVDARLVDFQDGTVLTEQSLDLDGNQAHFLIQEMRDDLDAAVVGQLGPSYIEQITNAASESAVLTILDHPDWGGAGVTITQADDPPLDPAVGDVWYDSSDFNKSYRWDGTVWSPLVTSIHGSLVVDGTIVGSKILANTIGASHLNVTTLSAIAADLGTINTGYLNLASDGTHRLEISSNDTYPLWYGTGAKTDANAKFYIKEDGTAVFKGSLSAATGTFAGSLSAATGTFAGGLTAATGTFSGTLTASAINAVNTLNIAGSSITVPASSVSGDSGVGTSETLLAACSINHGYNSGSAVAVQRLYITYVAALEATKDFWNPTSVTFILKHSSGAVLKTWSAVYYTSNYSGDNRENMPVTLAYSFDTSLVGSQTYYIYAYKTGSVTVNMRSQSMLILGTKR